MPQLSFMEEMKDRATKLIPCAFSARVEEATSDVLTAPDYDSIMYICDQTNMRSENAVDVVRAIRRRIDAPNPKVQYFTVVLLDALVKNCYEDFHNELADCKALQRALVAIAVHTPIRDGEHEAKKCALTLLLNMSYWFIGATEDKTKMLSKLADEVRAETNALAFEDIEADPSYQLKRAPPRYARQAHADAQRPVPIGSAHHVQPLPPTGSHQSRPQSSSRRQQQQRIVDAIPVEQFTGEEISGMLDACMLLGECLSAIEAEQRSVMGDDAVASIAMQVRRDHRKLATLLSSGADMENLDVLLSVSDSQTSIIQRLAAAVQAQGQQLQDVARIDEDDNDHPSSGHMQQQQQQQQPDENAPRPGTVVVPDRVQGSVPTGTTAAASSSPATSAANHNGPQRGARTAMDIEDTTPTTSSGAHQQQQPLNRPAPPRQDNDLDDFFAPSPTSSQPIVPAPEPAPAPAPPRESSTVAPERRAAAPKPYQVMNPSSDDANSDARFAAHTDGSINDGGDDDDFDNFLNNRLEKNKKK